MEKEILLPIQQQMVKHTEISRCTNPLKSSQGIQLRNRQSLRKQLFDLPDSLLQTVICYPQGMIPQRPLNACGTVAEFSKDHGSGNGAASLAVIGNSVLFPAQQNISAAFPADPRQKPSSWCAECQPDSLLGAGSHQGRGRPGIGEADDGLQGMQRIPGNHFPVPVCQHIFPL